MSLTAEEQQQLQLLTGKAAAANGNANLGFGMQQVAPAPIAINGFGGASPQSGAFGGAPANAAVTQAIPRPTGMRIPLKFYGDNGSVRVELEFGPEAACSVESILNILGALKAANVPLDFWKSNGAKNNRF